jgi:hypothetical protein
MTVNYTTNLALAQPVTGTESGTWGDDVNNGLTSYLDNAIAGTVTLTNDGAVTLSNTQGTSSATNIVSSLTGAGTVSAQFAIIRVTGTLTTAKVLTAPSLSKTYVVVNAATGSTVTIKASGQSGVSVAVGESATVYFNGTDYVKSATTTAGSGTVTSVAASVPAFLSIAGSPITTSGTLAITYSGTALPVANGGTGLTSGTSGGVLYYSATGTLASSAALAANAIVLGGGAGAAPATTTTGTGVVTALGVNTGTAGAFVVNGGALGTPSSGTLTSATGLPISTGVSGLGTGVATFLATPTSANLAAALTDETGTGANVFATSPTLVTPILGTPTSGTLSNCTVDGTNSVGYLNIPQNSQSAAYTLVLSDAGKHIYHPSTDANARTYTIPANSSVAYPIGTAITFINMTSQVVTIAITTDTMYLSSAGTTGSRSLAQYGSATAIKMTSTTWLISGSGLT